MTKARTLRREVCNSWVYSQVDDYSHRIEVYCGGAGSGKSYGAMQKMLLKALNYRRRVLVVRKVADTLRASVFELLLQLLRDSGLYEVARIRRSEMRVTLPGGSEFLFRGIDDPEKVKSITGLTDIVIEEATELSREDFIQLNLRLRCLEPFPQIYVLFNPISKANWVYDRFILHPPENCRLVRTTWKDNRFLPEEYGRELETMAETDPVKYRIYALGEFATLDRLVFPQVEVRAISPQEVEGLPFFGGLDFGYVNDPTALVWGRYDRTNRRIFILGEYFGKGMLNRQIAEKIQQMGLSKEIWTADSSEIKSIDELRSLGLSRVRAARKGPGSVRFGLSWLAGRSLILQENCPRLLEEFENYTWKKDPRSGEYCNEPIDSWNHGIDALRYGLEHQMRGGGMEVLKWNKEV